MSDEKKYTVAEIQSMMFADAPLELIQDWLGFARKDQAEVLMQFVLHAAGLFDLNPTAHDLMRTLTRRGVHIPSENDR